MGRYKAFSQMLKAVVNMSVILHMLSKEYFGGILVGNWEGFTVLVNNRPESRDFQLCLKVMLARAIFLVLVLFSTIVQAPLDGQQKKVTLTCQSQPKALPCKLTIVASLTIAVHAETGPHSLTSRVSSHTHVSLLFLLDPVSVVSITVGGICV